MEGYLVLFLEVIMKKIALIAMVSLFSFSLYSMQKRSGQALNPLLLKIKKEKNCSGFEKDGKWLIPKERFEQVLKDYLFAELPREQKNDPNIHEILNKLDTRAMLNYMGINSSSSRAKEVGIALEAFHKAEETGFINFDQKKFNTGITCSNN